MRIKDLHNPQGYITLELKESELRAMTNLLYEATISGVSFDKEGYLLYSNLYTAVSILSHGYLPDFELNLIRALRDKKMRKEVPNEEVQWWQ